MENGFDPKLPISAQHSSHVTCPMNEPMHTAPTRN
jgi:hypothetical protein